MSMDRAKLNHALSKVIAYKNAGKQHEAEEWARRLVELLECAGIPALRISHDAEYEHYQSMLAQVYGTKPDSE